jgi:hypothetical protein
MVWTVPPPPSNPSATPGVLDIVLTKNLVTPVSLTVCSALRSDHLPVLIDTACRSTFVTLPYRPDFERSDQTRFQDCLEDKLPFNPELYDKEAVDTYVRDLSSQRSGFSQVAHVPLFEKILLTMILKEVSERGLCLGSDPNTSLCMNSPASLKE